MPKADERIQALKGTGVCVPVIWVASSIIGFVFFATAVGPEKAVAGAFKCDSHSLSQDDEDSLRAAAQAVLPKSARLAAISPCRSLGSAHAWIDTRKTTSAEGVQWWEFTCWRPALRRQCDPPEFNQLIVLPLTVGGSSDP
jgi:hypothetical protein